MITLKHPNMALPGVVWCPGSPSYAWYFHADQHNGEAWAQTTRAMLSIYLKALCLSVLSITDHYGQVWRDWITNISIGQSEASIVTPTDQSEAWNRPIVPGAQPKQHHPWYPDCWVSGCPRIINFTLCCFCSCWWHLDPGQPPALLLTSRVLTKYLYLLLLPPSSLWRQNTDLPAGLVMAIIPPEFHPNNLIELANCNFSNLAFKGLARCWKQLHCFV